MDTHIRRRGALCILAMLGLTVMIGCSPQATEEHGKAHAATTHAGKPAHTGASPERIARADPAPTTTAVGCADCGVVVSVRESDQEGKGSGLGVVAGGLAGGVIGNQVGSGTGRDLATIAGAVGGAIAGNTIEKKMKKNRIYDVTVRMDSGEERVLRLKASPGVMAGDPVRVEGERLIRR